MSIHSHIFETLKTYKAIAFVCAFALLLWSLGIPSWLHSADAASLTSVSDTLSDSDLSVDSVHTVQFTTPTGISAGQTVRVTFDPSTQDFNFTGVTAADVASSTVYTVHTGAGSCAAGTDFYVNTVDTSNDYVEYILCPTDTVSPGTTLDFVIGSTTANMITNPGTEKSYVIRINGTMTDSADTRVAIINDVNVSAVVETTLTFTISGVATSSSVNGDTTTVGSSTTSIPFQILTVDTPAIAAQDLSVTTNARNGFTVTVNASSNLVSSTGADIDTFIDGATTSSPTAWQSPTPVFGDEDTYGHWGLTTEDSSLSDGDSFSSQLYVGNFIAEPREVFYHTAPANGTTANEGSTRVGYQVEISSLQEAGTDYSSTLTYVATPVF